VKGVLAIKALDPWARSGDRAGLWVANWRCADATPRDFAGSLADFPPKPMQAGDGMPKTVKDMMAAANAVVPRISFGDAKAAMEAGALVVDVRDGPEVETSGKVPGAVHVSRGMLEFRADPESPYHNPEFRTDRPVLVYCASGGRSALAGQVLQEMGFATVYNLGAFKDWVAEGGAVETPLDKGM
jgi:rhodanese-related sulfurtransferase